MKKIILSILAIALTVGVVSGTAYALFSSTATVQGVTFATGNADLEVYNGNNWTNNWEAGNFIFQGLYPSAYKKIAFNLKNSSLSAISLNLSGQLLNGATEEPAGSWNVLRDNVWVRITNQDGSVSLTGDWRSIKDWNSSNVTIGDYLTPDQNKWYNFEVYVNPNSGNEIAQKALSGMTFQFTGTQQ